MRARIDTLEDAAVDVRARFITGSDAAIQRALDKPYPITGLKGRPIKDILEEVNAVLKDRNIEEEETYFSEADWNLPDDRKVWPGDWRWVSCFPVRGTSEGYYIHIEIIHQDPADRPTSDYRRRLIGMAKCWRWETALAMAAVAAELFEGPQSWKLSA